jgi:hypothetical protein
VWRFCCWLSAGQQAPARAVIPSAHWLKTLHLLLLLTQQFLEQHLTLLLVLLAALKRVPPAQVDQWLQHQPGGSAGATGRVVQAAVLDAVQAAVAAAAAVANAVVAAPHPHQPPALSAAIAGRQRRLRATPAAALPVVVAIPGAGASMGASCRLLLMVRAVYSSLACLHGMLSSGQGCGLLSARNMLDASCRQLLMVRAAWHGRILFAGHDECKARGVDRASKACS